MSWPQTRCEDLMRLFCECLELLLIYHAAGEKSSWVQVKVLIDLAKEHVLQTWEEKLVLGLDHYNIEYIYRFSCSCIVMWFLIFGTKIQNASVLFASMLVSRLGTFFFFFFPVLGTPGWKVFKYGTSVPPDSKMNSLDFDGHRSKLKVIATYSKIVSHNLVDMLIFCLSFSEFRVYLQQHPHMK